MDADNWFVLAFFKIELQNFHDELNRDLYLEMKSQIVRGDLPIFELNSWNFQQVLDLGFPETLKNLSSLKQLLFSSLHRGAFIYDVRCFSGIFDLPTYPHQILYYISLFSKIRWSLTYVPTQKSDVICECSLCIWIYIGSF